MTKYPITGIGSVPLDFLRSNDKNLIADHFAQIDIPYLIECPMSLAKQKVSHWLDYFVEINFDSLSIQNLIQLKNAQRFKIQIPGPLTLSRYYPVKADWNYLEHTVTYISQLFDHMNAILQTHCTIPLSEYTDAKREIILLLDEPALSTENYSESMFHDLQKLKIALTKLFLEKQQSKLAFGLHYCGSSEDWTKIPISVFEIISLNFLNFKPDQSSSAVYYRDQKAAEIYTLFREKILILGLIEPSSSSSIIDSSCLEQIKLIQAKEILISPSCGYALQGSEKMISDFEALRRFQASSII